MKKILLYIYPGFAEFEITTAISLLKSSYIIKTFALTAAPIHSEAGLTIIPDLTIDDVIPEEFEAIIIPGGDMAVNVNAYPLYKLIYQLYSQKKLVAAICSGPFLLAQAGILSPHPYTVTYTKEQRELLGCFIEEDFCSQPIVVSEGIITAQGHAFVDFALILYQALIGKPSPDEAFYKGLRNQFMEPA